MDRSSASAEGSVQDERQSAQSCDSRGASEVVLLQSLKEQLNQIVISGPTLLSQPLIADIKNLESKKSDLEEQMKENEFGQDKKELAAHL